jgi:hypothetical protein
VWVELDILKLVQIGIGALLGAFLLLTSRRNSGGTSRLALNIVVCAGMGFASVILIRWPGSPLWVVVGLASVAAPITLVVEGSSPVTTFAEARELLGRIAAELAVHTVAGVTSAIIGFLAAMVGVQALAILT